MNFICPSTQRLKAAYTFASNKKTTDTFNRQKNNNQCARPEQTTINDLQKKLINFSYWFKKQFEASFRDIIRGDIVIVFQHIQG